MRTRAILPLMLFCLLPTILLAKGPIEDSDWKIKSYRFPGYMAAWGDNQAKALIGRTLSIRPSTIKLGDSLCKGSVKPVNETDAKKLALGEPSYCGKGKPTP